VQFLSRKGLALVRRLRPSDIYLNSEIGDNHREQEWWNPKSGGFTEVEVITRPQPMKKN
jgi:hypothetical protein